MLKDRLISGLLLGGSVVAAFSLPRYALVSLLLAFCTIAQVEFYVLLSAIKIRSFKIIGTLSGAALIVATAVSLHLSNGATDDGEAILIVIFVILILLRQLPQKNNQHPVETMAGTILGFFYIAFLLNFMTKLFLVWGETDGRWLILYMIVVTKFTDIGAYFVGCSIGRHKMFPRISPAKTWEGTIGGVLTAVAVSCIVSLVSGGDLGVVSLDLRHAVILGVLLSVSGILGDLTESLFKRAAGIKDSGKLIKGMGGILDIIDSLLFAAPTMYIYARFFMDRI